MLERLRFQEISRAIFRVKDDIVLNNTKYKKGQPFLIVDDATASKFNIITKTPTAFGRGNEGGTSTIEGIYFDLVEGHVLFNLFSSIFGETKTNEYENMTAISSVILDNDDTIELPTAPVEGTLLLYLNGDKGGKQLLSESQYTIEDYTIIKLIKPYTGEIFIIYEEGLHAKSTTTVKQLGQHLNLSLELQCIALDVVTGDKEPMILKFDNVNTSTDLSMTFNKSSQANFSIIHCEILPQKPNSGINKPLFELFTLYDEET